MSGAMRRIGEYLGLLEEAEYYDDEFVDERPERQAAPSHSSGSRAGGRADSFDDSRTEPAPVSNIAQRRRVPQSPPAVPHGTVAELSRITTLHPSTYNEARTVGENYRDGTPVIMNLSEMDDADAKRLVDFAAGLIFATRGTIERVTAKVFLLSPPNVSVAAEDKQRIAEGGFFNQS
jgi:cell division inhibitor SepF